MKKCSLLVVVLIIALSMVHAQEKKYTPTPENLKNREWFQNAKFGLFIHWGVYSVLGDGEWVMNTQQIPIKTYEKLPAFFNPTEFNAAEWVQMAKDAGMKYITITSKHHDGFAMFDSRVSDYNIVKIENIAINIIQNVVFGFWFIKKYTASTEKHIYKDFVFRKVFNYIL